MPPGWKLRDFLWPEIDGWHVIPLGVCVALGLTVLPIWIARLIDYVLR